MVALGLGVMTMSFPAPSHMAGHRLSQLGLSPGAEVIVLHVPETCEPLCLEIAPQLALFVLAKVSPPL